MNRIHKLTAFLPALLLSLFLAGCVDTTGPSAGVPETPSATPQLAVAGVPTGSATVTVTAYPSYGRAEDYTWVAGQLSRQGSCWVLTYISPLSKVKPDQYSNRFALLPGSGWDQAAVTDGEWVVATGQPEAGTAPVAGCAAHGYLVSALQPNPNANNGGGSTPMPAAGTPGGGNGGTNLDIQVTQLSVSSNFEIRGQFTATNKGTVNMQEPAPIRIQLKLPGGEPVFEADAPSIQGGVLDTKPMAGLPPGASRPYGFSAAPGSILKPVAQGDEVTGTLTVEAGGQPLQVALPLTKVTQVRIP